MPILPLAACASLPDLAEICRHFAMAGRWRDGRPHGHGHINDTYVVTFEVGGRSGRYVLQRINTRVFRNPAALMDNVARVCSFAAARLMATPVPDAFRRALTLIPAESGRAYYVDPAGGWWRAYHFIEGAQTFDRIESPAQARRAAYAFGRFQALLCDLPLPRLHETIPHFHDTPRRLANLEDVVGTDPAGRVAESRAEIAFARERAALAEALPDLQAGGDLPERITHNDTKLNNVMCDSVTEEALCVIDLDTVMPGLGLYDFGDLTRSATNAADEDETDLARVHVQLPIFAALIDGYRQGAGAMLTRAESENLALAGRVLTFENGLRFLTDYLAGDTYYKIQRPRHNLDRARNQFALLRSMEAQRTEMERLCRERGPA